MRKSIILVIALMVSAMTFAQERDYNTLKGLIFGIGLPLNVEICRVPDSRQISVTTAPTLLTTI